MKLKILAPAKINLSLEVIGKRENGYHEVDMVMQSINLFDEVYIEENNESDIKVMINKDIKCDEKENIAYKSAKKFFEYTGIKNKGINISINKNIPVQAGLAGGSSDGAAVIVGLNKIFGNILSNDQMMKLGEEIGADVPFCILGGTARAQGIGTDLTPLTPLKEIFVVLIKPNLSVSTKEAYQMIDSLRLYNNDKTLNLVKAIQSQDIHEILCGVYNHFEEIKVINEVKSAKKFLKNCGANAVCMSGSGPSVFGLYLDKNEAIKSFNSCKLNNMEAFLCEPINYGVKII